MNYTWKACGPWERVRVKLSRGEGWLGRPDCKGISVTLHWIWTVNFGDTAPDLECQESWSDDIVDWPMNLIPEVFRGDTARIAKQSKRLSLRCLA